MTEKEKLQAEIAELKESVKKTKSILSKKQSKLRKKEDALKQIVEAEKTEELVKLAEASREFFHENVEVYERFKDFYRTRRPNE